jgi:hypothetical protein
MGALHLSAAQRFELHNAMPTGSKCSTASAVLPVQLLLAGVCLHLLHCYDSYVVLSDMLSLADDPRCYTHQAWDLSSASHWCTTTRFHACLVMAAWQCYVFSAAACLLADRPRSFIDLIHSCISLVIAVTSNNAVNIEINIMLATKASAADHR